MSPSTKRQSELRKQIIAQLGGRCSNPGCRWLNEDGSLGCTDVSALQIDHVGGGGSVELRAGGAGLKHLYRVRNDLKWVDLAGLASQYQVLCANCNWTKSHQGREARGFFQHRQRGDSGSIA